jgi:hypothetical protein
MMPVRDAFPEGRRQRTRSLAVTLFLALLIVLYSFTVSVNITALTNPDFYRELQNQYPNAPVWFLPVLTIGAALNIIWCIALLRWKKWAFYALLLTSLGMSGLHLVLHQTLAADRSVVVGAVTIVGAVAVLFVLLILGGPRSTWRQLD